MKIEKISESQIRCTLNRDDLVDREIRISELAYGTEKAKALFRDMMQQASYEFGFEADDIPLMIEAIPISSECLILVITKVEDPDELDTRFSKFSSGDEYDDNDFYDSESHSGADEILDLFKKISGELDEINNDIDDFEDVIDEEAAVEVNDFIPLPETIAKNNKHVDTTQPKKSTKNSATINTNLVKTYSFDSLNTVSKLSNIIVFNYNGENTLYKNPVTEIYYLVVNKSEHSPEEFNKICNIISEYGKKERTTYASTAFYQEHYEIIVRNKAVQVLSQV